MTNGSFIICLIEGKATFQNIALLKNKVKPIKLLDLLSYFLLSNTILFLTNHREVPLHCWSLDVSPSRLVWVDYSSHIKHIINTCHAGLSCSPVVVFIFFFIFPFSYLHTQRFTKMLTLTRVRARQIERAKCNGKF